MNTRRSLPFALALGSAALLLVFILPTNAQNAREDTKTLAGKPAPEFTLKTLDGKEVKLSALKGNVVVLDFWATWCPPCRKSLPHLQAVSQNKELASKGLTVLAVNAGEKTDKIEPFMKQNNYSFTVPLDADNKTGTAYKVRGIPTTVIVGRTGKISKVFVGYAGEESAKEMDEAINEALKEPKPAA